MYLWLCYSEKKAAEEKRLEEERKLAEIAAERAKAKGSTLNTHSHVPRPRVPANSMILCCLYGQTDTCGSLLCRPSVCPSISLSGSHTLIYWPAKAGCALTPWNTLVEEK